MIINQTGGGKTSKIYDTPIDITPNSYDQTVSPPEGYDGMLQVVVAGDSDLKSSNIKKGVNIFGFVGNYEGAETVILNATTTTIPGWYDATMSSIKESRNVGGNPQKAYGVRWTGDSAVKVTKTGSTYNFVLPRRKSGGEMVYYTPQYSQNRYYWSTRTWNIPDAPTSMDTAGRILKAMQSNGFRGTVTVKGILVMATQGAVAGASDGTSSMTYGEVTYTVTASTISGSLTTSATSSMNGIGGGYISSSTLCTSPTILPLSIETD